jgi:hypothetical protein
MMHKHKSKVTNSLDWSKDKVAFNYLQNVVNALLGTVFEVGKFLLLYI